MAMEKEIFENDMLWKIFGHKKGEVTKLAEGSERLHNLYFSPNISG
jgi:hypothetical protein